MPVNPKIKEWGIWGQTFPKKRRMSETETRRNDCFAGEEIASRYTRDLRQPKSNGGCGVKFQQADRELGVGRLRP